MPAAADRTARPPSPPINPIDVTLLSQAGSDVTSIGLAGEAGRRADRPVPPGAARCRPVHGRLLTI